MAGEYSVPKREIPALVSLPGREPEGVTLYLGYTGATHSGQERPSDILNGPREFIPMNDARDGFVFLQRDALLVVKVALEHERGDEPTLEEMGGEGVTTVRVAVTLEDGSSLQGRVSFLLPEGQRRFQNLLNNDDLFLPVRDDEHVSFVNKRRILKVSVVEKEEVVAHARYR